MLFELHSDHDQDFQKSYEESTMILGVNHLDHFLNYQH